MDLKGEALEKKYNEDFEPLWKHFDVNNIGHIDMDRAPVFLRAIVGNAELAFGL